MLGRAKKWSMVGLLGGAVFALGCPGKDAQELKPLSHTHESESTDTRKPEAPPSAGDAPVSDEETAAGTTGAWNGGATTAYSTGVSNWREVTPGRKAGADVTFGPGRAGAADARWAFNADSTGGVGEALGFGATYGASTGKLDVVPGTPTTRADNWPTVQANASPNAGGKTGKSSKPATQAP